MIAGKATGIFTNTTICSGETTVLAFFFLKQLCLLILKSNNNLSSYVRG